MGAPPYERDSGAELLGGGEPRIQIQIIQCFIYPKNSAGLSL